MGTVIGAVRPVHLRWRFTVEIDRFASFAFTKMGAFKIEFDVDKLYEGGSMLPIQTPSRATIPDVEFTRGAGLDHDMYEWALEVADIFKNGGLPDGQYKRDGDVVQRDRTGAEVHRHHFIGGWPKVFDAGEWDNNSDEHKINSMTLVMDAWKLVL